MVGTAIVDNSLLCGVQRHLPPRRCSKALTSKKTTTLGGCRRRRCGGGVGGREEQREQGLEKTKSEMNRVPSVPIFLFPFGGKSYFSSSVGGATVVVVAPRRPAMPSVGLL